MKKLSLFIFVIIFPTFIFGQIIYSNSESSKFLTTYTNGAPNDSIFVFCKPAATSTLIAKMTGGTAPYTFNWFKYNTTTHAYTAFSTSTSASTSTITTLSSGGYSVVITDATSATLGCDISWVWNIDMTPDAGADITACLPFSMAGTVNMNNTGTFKYYNPQASSLIIGASTTINVCLDVLHTFVSDMSFHLIGPASCGSPDITLSANPGSIGQGAYCNSGSNCSNLCFSSSSSSNLDVCLATTPLTGTYGRYGLSPGTAINWASLIGCNASTGGWKIQIYDCYAVDVGTLTDATISFSNPPTICGPDNISYYTGIVNSSITDNACTAGTASLFTIPLDTLPISVTNTNTYSWTASPFIAITNSTTLSPSVAATLYNATTFFLTVNSNHGCTRVDSLHFTPCVVVPPIIYSDSESSKFLTSYTNGSANDTVFVFCKPSAPSILKAKMTGGVAPYTFKWFQYNTTSHIFPTSPFITTTGASTSTVSSLLSGGYKVVITDATSSIMGCDIAWVWNIDITPDAGSDITGCLPFSMSGSVNMNNTNQFKYYNPQADDLIITSSTTISVCFNVIHTYVSDLSFHLVGPASCGSPDIILSANPGSIGQSATCNSGNNCNNLCFSTTSSTNLNVCLATTPLTGTYGRYGPAAGTPISWSTLYGCNASNGGWTVQVYDCTNLDFGTLTDATISFSGTGLCGPENVSYYSGIINSTINDNTCTPGTASIYSTPLDTTPIIVTNINTFQWTALPTVSITNATTLTPSVASAPMVNTTFFLTVNSNHGCTKTDSLHFIYNPPAAPVFTPVPALCNNSSAVTLSATPAGGTFSGTGVTGSSFNPFGLSGNITITYSVNSAGCTAVGTTTANITVQPVSTFYYAGDPYCQYGANPSPTYIAGGIAGTFSSTPPGLSINSSSGLIDLTATTPGFYTITNSVPSIGGCSPTVSNTNIQVTALPLATFDYTGSPFCVTGGIQSPNFVGAGQPGVFSSTLGLTVDVNTGEITPSTSTPGTYWVYNTLAASDGCSDVVDSFQISIVSIPVATFSYSGTPYCQSGTNPLPTFSGGAVPGTFTSSPLGLSINSGTGAINLSASTPGITYTVTNTITASGSCAGATANSNITITAPANASFSYTGSPYCISGSNPSPTIIGTAGTFTAFPAGLSINSLTGAINLSLSSVGSYTVTNTLPASAPCPIITATATVIINPSPTASFTYSSATYCVTGSNPAPTITGTAGTFTSSPAGLSINSSTGIITLSTSTTGITYTITNTVAASGGCAPVSATATVTLSAISVASFSYTGSPYCIGGANPSPTYSGGGVAGTFTFTPAGLVINSSTGVVDLTASSAGTYIVTNTIAAGVCPFASANTTIVINAPAIATFSYTGSPYCVSGTDPTPTLVGSAGTFTSAPAGLSINSSNGLINLAASTTGITYTVTNTIGASGGCNPVIATATVIINPVSVATFSYSGSSYCIGGTNPSPTFSGGGVAGIFTFTPAGLVINSSTGVVDLTTSSAGTYTVTNTIAAGVCPSASANATIVINAPAVATFNYGGGFYCVSGTDPTPTILGTAGVFSVLPAGLSINSSTGQVTLSSSACGNYIVTNTISATGGCNAINANSVIHVVCEPEATFSYSGSPYCIGGTDPSPTFSGAAGAGIFTASSTNLILDSLTGIVDLTTSLAGTYTVTNTIAAGICPAVIATSIIVINAPAVASFSYSGSPYCISGTDPSPTLVGSTGIFTFSPIGLSINSSSGLISLSGSSANTFTVFNTIAATGGCPVIIDSSIVMITPVPVATFSYAGSPYCVGGTNPSPTFTLGGVAGTFTFSPAGLVINPSTGIVDLTTSSAGTYTVTNSIVAGVCPSVSATATIVINAPAGATFSYTGNPYCQSGVNPLPTFSSGGVGGSFSSTAGLSILAGTGLVNLSGSTPNTYTVTNTLPASGGCPVITATASIVITSAFNATFSYSGTPYCSGGANPSPNFGGVGMAGIFTSTAGLVIDSITGVVDLITSTAGTYSITNTIATSGSCPGTSITSSITINTPTVATFSYIGSPYCTTSIDPLPTFSGGGVAGIFTSSPAGLIINSSSGLVTLAGSTANTYTVTNTIAATGGCPIITATATIVVNAPPTTTFSYTNTPYCLAGTNPLPTITGTSGAFTALPTTLSINAVSGLVDLVASGAGSYTVTNTVPAGGGCPAVASTSTIDIVTTPVATFSYTSNPYCTTSTDPLPTFGGGGTAGVFTSLPSTGITLNSLTGLVTLASTSGTFTITNTISATAGCPAITATASITVNTPPTATFNYTGTPYCLAGTNPLPTITGTSGTFTAVPSSLSINSVSGLVDLIASGVGSFTVTNTVPAGGGCPAVSSTSTIDILATPVATFSYTSNPYCSTSTDPLPTYSGGGTAGIFTSFPSTGITLNSTTGLVTLASTSGTFTITNTISATAGCPAITATASITVNTPPTATFSYTGTPYCLAGTNPLPTITGTSGTFTAVPASLSINAVSGLVDLIGSGAGSYTVTNTVPAGGGCPAVSSSSVIDIVITPVDSFAYSPLVYCVSGTDPSPVYNGGGVAGVFTSGGGLSLNSSTGIVTLATSTPGTYVVTNTISATAGCPVITDTSSIIIVGLPVAAFSYTGSPYCASAANPSPTLSGSAGTFTSTSGLTIDSVTGVIDLATSSTGTYTVTNTINSGVCSGTNDSTTVTIVPTPVATFNYDSVTYCNNGVVQTPVFSSGGAAGVFTSSPPGLILNSSTGDVTLATSNPGTYTITNTITSGGTCPVISDTSLIVINAMQNSAFNYSTNYFCTSNALNPIPASITTIGGTFASSPAGMNIDTNTGVIDLTTTTAGVYIVTYISPGPCATSSNATITIVNPPIANAGADGALICGAGAATLDGSGSTLGTNFTTIWTTTTGAFVSGDSTVTPVVNQAGTYILTVTDTAGQCSNTDTVVVVGSAPPAASFTANPITGAPPLNVDFLNTSTGTSLYSWSFGDGGTSSLFSPSNVFFDIGNYTVVLIASDTSGCADTTSTTIIVNEDYSLIIPNIFTPNGDNVNDVFTLIIKGAKELEGDIFDRWGIKVFTFHAPKEAWDGRTISGQTANAGTYYYIIKATSYDGSVHEEKGSILLMR